MRMASVLTDAATHLRHMKPTPLIPPLVCTNITNALHAVEEHGDIGPPV